MRSINVLRTMYRSLIMGLPKRKQEKDLLPSSGSRLKERQMAELAYQEELFLKTPQKG